MDRKWRTNRAALHTVQPFPDFISGLPPRDAAYDLASESDLYAVYTVLHIEGKQSELRWSPDGRFYFFFASQLLDDGEAPREPAPEGDEDPPPVVPQVLWVQSVSGGGRASGCCMQRHVLRPLSPQCCTPQERGPATTTPSAAPGHPAGPADVQQQQQQQPPEQPQREPPAQQQARLRTQVVVPVSSGHGGLTPRLLQRLFDIRGVAVQQLLLALVDGHGVVTRSCLYNYIQAPLEGPGTAALDLLDD